MQPLGTAAHCETEGSQPPAGPGIVYMPVITRPLQFDKYPKVKALVLGIVQVVIGGLCIIFNSVMLGVDRYRFISSGLGQIGHGFWLGLTFIATGALGIATWKNTTKCKILSFMVMSITSASLTTILLILGISGTVFSAFNHRSYFFRSYDVNFEMAICLVILAALEAAAAIWASIIGCRSVACCCGDQSQLFQIAVPVQYFKNSPNVGGQPMNPMQGVQGGQFAYSQPPVYTTLSFPQGEVIVPAFSPVFDQTADCRVSVGMDTDAFAHDPELDKNKVPLLDVELQPGRNSRPF